MDFVGLSVVADNDVWFAANALTELGWVGLFVHWDGVSWTQSATTTSALLGVTAVAGSEVWGASADGGIAHWDGSKLSVGSPAGGYVFDLSAVSSGDVWAAGG